MLEETSDNNPSLEEQLLPVPALPRKETPGAAVSEGEPADQGQDPSVSRKCQEDPKNMVVHKLRGIGEAMRGPDGVLRTVHFDFSVPSNSTKLFQQMVAQGQYARDPSYCSPIPTGQEGYGKTELLFRRIKLAIGEQTNLSDERSALLTFWVLSTWFQDILPLAPGLALTGWAHTGDVVLRTLMAFCYHPALLAGISIGTLNDVRWERKPTLLITDPNLNRRMAVLLGSSTCRGYQTFRKVAGRPALAFDYFSSKAIFLGDNPQMGPTLQNYLHINVSPVPDVESLNVSPLSEEATQNFQNQLFSYRINSLLRAHTSDFYAAGLSSELTSIANVLGRCIVDAPDLQCELVSLLKPYSQQQIAERLDDVGTLVVEAALYLCHQGNAQILVGEIAAEVNCVLKGRGERLQLSPEKVGHRLKKAGMLSRRLSAAGNGFVLDHATQVLLHEVAAAYGCVGLTDNNKNLHCPLCEQNRRSV